MLGEDADAGGVDGGAVEEFDGAEGGAGVDVAFDLAAAGGGEAGGVELDAGGGAEEGEGGEEGAFDEVEGGGEGVVGAAFEDEGGGGVGLPEGGEEGLEEEAGAAGGADGEAVAARCDFAGAEVELGGADRGAVGDAVGDGAGGVDAGEVLAHEAGLGASPADVGHAEGLAGDHGEGEGGAEHLAAAAGAVEEDGFHGEWVVFGWAASRRGRFRL